MSEQEYVVVDGDGLPCGEPMSLADAEDLRNELAEMGADGVRIIGKKIKPASTPEGWGDFARRMGW